MHGLSAPAIHLNKLSPGLSGTCKQYLERYRKEAEASIRGGGGGIDVSRKYSAALDGLLGSLFCASRAAAVTQGIAPAGRVALVAVGGFGRGLVALHSDVDVLVLCDNPADPHVSALAEGLLYPLWDLGLQIGHVVRGVKETLALARKDVRTATTLLDIRRVAGDESIVAELHSGARRHVFEPVLGEFIDALVKDVQERHERFGGSLFLLEPEVKMGRGGVRDIDVAVWAAQARWDCKTTTDFVTCGALLAREVEELEEAREALWKVRNLLHLRAGRRQDRLTFEDQEETAAALGFANTHIIGVEQFMQTYYRHARIVAQTAERMLVRARPRPRMRRQSVVDHGDGTLSFDGHVTLKDSKDLETDPGLAFRFYQQVVRTNEPPYPFARDAIARMAVDHGWQARLRADSQAAVDFVSLLSHAGVAPVRRGSILGELHEMGLMLAMIPEFEAVTGRVQHDVYHVYTVDVHSVAAVDTLRELVRGDLKREHVLPCRLAADAPRPTPLFLAVLLHDVGKAHGKDHSEKGADMAGPIAARLGFSPADQDHVVWLVREHLSLYHWATRRDTSDPETLREIAAKVGTPERLRDLYLLTFADLSTTNPGAMTAWKARMFEDLFFRVSQILEGVSPSSDGARVAQLRDAAVASFAEEPDRDVLAAFVASMPERYILATSAEEMRAHGRTVAARKGAPVFVVCKKSADGESAEVVVITDDRPGLLADVAAVLAANRLSVAGAQIYGRTREGAPDEVFDLFAVRKPGGASLDAETTATRVQKDLEALFAGTVTASELLARIAKAPAWAQRKSPEVRTEVVVDNAASSQFTVVDVFTKDRIGLLHLIARALHEQGLTIALSKISTEGHRAADVFYVRDEHGGKIAGDERLTAVADALRAVLGAEEQRQASSL